MRMISATSAESAARTTARAMAHGYRISRDRGHSPWQRVAVPSPSRLSWLALSVVYVLWGSTYLANSFLLASVPSLLAVAFRFLVGGAVLAAVILVVAGRA